jgi:hypothetical protein
MSQPVFTGNFLVISRSSRFTWFLTTALPTRRLTVNPNLDKANPLGIALTTTSLPAQDFPSL